MFRFYTFIYKRAMYKNTGTGKGMRGVRGIWGMLYFGECRQTFRGISSNILGNVVKHSGECRQIFRGMSPNIMLCYVMYSLFKGDAKNSL